MIAYQKVIATLPFTDSFKPDKALVTFDLLNDTIFQIGISFDQQVDFVHSEFVLMPGEVVQGITPPRVTVIVGQKQYGGTIFITARAPAGGTAPIGAPGSELTIIGYEAGRQPITKTYMNRISNVGNTIGTVVSGATNVQNDGNPIGTSIIESTPSGAAQTWNCTNDGVISIKGDVGGVLTQLLQTVPGASGLNQSSVKLGDSGRQVEVNGQFLVDLMALFSGRIQPNVAADNSFAGSVAGTMSIFFPFWGTAIKCFVIIFSGYNSLTAHTFLFPSAVTVGMYFLGNDSPCTFQFLNGASGVQVNAVTGLATGTADGTQALTLNVHNDSFGMLNLTADRIQNTPSGNVGTGILLFIGQ